VAAVVREGERLGCKEVLFSLGEKPEQRYPAAARRLAALGYTRMTDYLAEMCAWVLRETSLIPHVNAGTLADDEIAMLRPVSGSMGHDGGEPVAPHDGAGGPVLHFAGADIPLPGRAGAVGERCMLGIRPEKIRFVAPGTPGSFPVAIEAETPLNEKTVTLAATETHSEILISRPSNVPGPGHGDAHIAFDMSGALLFDRATGERLAVTRVAAMQGAAR